jgi:hypothetical protein
MATRPAPAEGMRAGWIPITSTRLPGTSHQLTAQRDTAEFKSAMSLPGGYSGRRVVTDALVAIMVSGCPVLYLNHRRYSIWLGHAMPERLHPEKRSSSCHGQDERAPARLPLWRLAGESGKSGAIAQPGVARTDPDYTAASRVGAWGYWAQPAYRARRCVALPQHMLAQLGQCASRQYAGRGMVP